MMHPFMFYACVERKSMCIQITCVYQAPGTTALDASPMPVWRVRLQKAINGTERRWRIRKCAAQQTDIFHKNAQWINIRCTMHVECKYIHVPLFNFHFFCLAVGICEVWTRCASLCSNPLANGDSFLSRLSFCKNKSITCVVAAWLSTTIATVCAIEIVVFGKRNRCGAAGQFWN